MTGLPPIRRRLLGAALRRYRENLGYGLEDAARILGCDRSKISRIETGQRGIRAEELRELLTEYGVASDEQAALLAIAHAGRAGGWWQGYPDVLSGTGQEFLAMEAAASEILAFAGHLVPDLLQTDGYARAVAEADPAHASETQRAHAVEVKLTRQRIILGERQPHLEVVLAEGALHQAVGGARVMGEQLARLAGLADDGAGVRVLPFAAGAHPAIGAGSMTILRFARTPSLGVVHLDALSGGVSLEDPADVARHVRVFQQLRAAALAPSVSARLLRELAAG